MKDKANTKCPLAILWRGIIIRPTHVERPWILITGPPNLQSSYISLDLGERGGGVQIFIQLNMTWTLASLVSKWPQNKQQL